MKEKIFAFACFSFLFFINVPAQVSIGSNTQLVGNGNINMVLSDLSFVNNGSFTAGQSTVHFNGNAIQSIQGSSTMAFNNLSVRKTGNSIRLQRNIDVNGNIIFTSGLFDLNNNIIILSPISLIVGETESARITGTNGGYVQITTTLNTPVSVNPGNLGVIITSGKNMGTTIIRRGHVSQSKPGVSNFSINRYYDINPANNSLLDATLQFNYFNAELNGVTETNLWLWKSNDVTNWFASPSTDSRDSIANHVTGKKIQDFNRWTLSGAYFPQSLYGPCADKTVLKVWPNPFTTDFNIGINSNSNATTTLHLYDITGRLIAIRSMTLRSGSNLYNFSFPGLPPGAYVIKIADAGCSITVGEIIKIN